MAAAFDNHKHHANYYDSCVVRYWAVDAMGQHACKPDEHWSAITVEAGNALQKYQLTFLAPDVHGAYKAVQMCEHAFNAGRRHKAEEIKTALYVKERL